MSMRDAYKNFPRGTYLYDFFSEKDVREMDFDITDSRGVSHIIPNEVVVEHIALTSGGERKKIEEILRKIDFGNGDVNHFLAHLAKGIAEQYAGVFASDGFRSKRASLLSDFPGASPDKQGGKTMRERMTRAGRHSTELTARSVMAEITELEARIAADADTELEADAAAIADEEADVTQESITGPELSEDILDENARANDNWPVADREAVASSLIRMAKTLLG